MLLIPQPLPQPQSQSQPEHPELEYVREPELELDPGCQLPLFHHEAKIQYPVSELAVASGVKSKSSSLPVAAVLELLKTTVLSPPLVSVTVIPVLVMPTSIDATSLLGDQEDNVVTPVPDGAVPLQPLFKTSVQAGSDDQIFHDCWSPQTSEPPLTPL